MSEAEIPDTLSLLNVRLSEPVWLFGGVAVDFVVGRWTRPHNDIDLHAYADSRERLSEELEAIGFRSANRGWLTHWRRADNPWLLEPPSLRHRIASLDRPGVGKWCDAHRPPLHYRGDRPRLDRGPVRFHLRLLVMAVPNQEAGDENTMMCFSNASYRTILCLR